MLARAHDLVVNDSLHPALLLAPALGFPFPVVQLYGENLWRAMEDNLDDRAPPWVAAVTGARSGSCATAPSPGSIHTLGTAEPEPGAPSRTYRLAPIVARPGRDPGRGARRARASPRACRSPRCT